MIRQVYMCNPILYWFQVMRLVADDKCVRDIDVQAKILGRFIILLDSLLRLSHPHTVF